MIVWNIGSILVDLIAEKHVLDSYEHIKSFIDSGYDFKSIGVQKKIT